MDYYRIKDHQPQEGETVWVEHEGEPIHASYQNGQFYDVLGGLLQGIEKWTTIHVVY